MSAASTFAGIQAQRRRAGVARSEGRYIDAAAVLRRAIDRAKEATDLDHSIVALLHADLALTYKRSGRLGDAEEHYRRALALLEATGTHAGAPTASVVDDYATLLAELGRDHEAIAVLGGAGGRRSPDVESSTPNPSPDR